MTSMTSSSVAALRELEAVSSHARVTTHAPHAAAKEGLEDAVRIHVVEAASAPSVLEVLAAVIHPPFLLVTQDGVSFSDLENQ